MRKFYLLNEINERFSLWGNRVYMVEPEGLGIKYDASYIRIGNSFLKDSRSISQSNIAGKIEFLEPGANKRFRAFYDFCAAAESLRLIYDAGDGTEYIRDIDIVEIGKTEKTGATLPISVSFACKSLYYLQSNNRFTFESSDSEKRYDYAYDYQYDEYGTYQADIYNNGHVDAPFECMIYGACANPAIYLLKDGELIYEVVFPIDVAEGEYIRYSSRDGELEATLVSGDTGKNLMNLLDISNANFFKIPVGNSKIIFSSSGANKNAVTITIYKMFEVV